ncbi:MAG: tRNA pseudouridine(13) synthase TruD [Candidatus Marsarchaeota archaeon]|nr:tRNA pseudouridine(13) synthase TruD [Candidatus Marsarchaeota archaeon]
MRFLSATAGTNGTIKTTPEDFIVNEITPNGRVLELSRQYTPVELGEQERADSKFTRFILQKRPWDTTGALVAIAKKLGHGKKSFGYAGTKDKMSTSTQLASIFGIEPAQLLNIHIKDISINGAWKGEEVILGSNIGNAFDIKIREANRSENAVKIIDELEGVFPNYFDRQRFGYRLNNFRIGRLILENRLEDAVMMFLTDSSNEVNKESNEARKRLSEEQDFRSALAYFPKHLKYERTVIEYMSRYNNYANALRKLPRGILLLFIHAVESGIFNTCLEQRIKSDDTGSSAVYLKKNKFGFPDSDTVAADGSEGFAAAPLIGYETHPKYLSEYEDSIMESVGIRCEDFKIKSMPELSMKGAFRVLLAPARNLLCDVNSNELRLKFEIPSGSYATVLANEITKTESIAMEAIIRES